MTTPPSLKLFKGRHFDQEIIVLCVRWYLSFKLSSRDLVQMMSERGVVLAHTTILRWVQRYVPEFEKRWSQYARPVNRSCPCPCEAEEFQVFRETIQWRSYLTDRL